MKAIQIFSESELGNLNEFLKRESYEEESFAVKKIVQDVKQRRNEALFEYTKKFDNFEVNDSNILVSDYEIECSKSQITKEQKEIIDYARKNIEKFHLSFLPKSSFIEDNGIILGTRVTAVKRSGLYIPGGKAFYPSTALMTIIPAIIAGVKEIIICTPSQKGEINPLLMYIASLYGINKIFKVGGAQAIAAMAYGTESIPKVDCIVGPGNIYVALAKKEVFGEVSIDSIAGPSEIMVVSDDCNKTFFVANDLLTQAEHDENAKVYFLSIDIDCMDKIQLQLSQLAKNTKRANIAQKAIENALFISTNLSLAPLIIDIIAPEHLELQVKDPYAFMTAFKNAGAIFIGEYSCETLGDYVAGPNHTLPTSQTARFASVLSCETFMKKSSIIHYSQQAMQKDAPTAIKFAEIEGLFAHAEALKVRL